MSVAPPSLHGWRWSSSKLTVHGQPMTVHTGVRHSSAGSVGAVSRRPACATEATSTPFVTTTATSASGSSSRTADTGTGPHPAGATTHASRRHRDRPDAGDLDHLAVHRVATHERRGIDPHDDLHVPTASCRWTGGA